MILLIVIELFIIIYLLFIILIQIYYKKNNNKNKKISIIIPCIPRDIKYLKRLINSINYQTYPPYEIIIALSGVTNYNKIIIEKNLKMLSKYPLYIINTEKIQYASENRNRGGKFASGDLYSFMDADDTFHPKKLEILNYYFSKYNLKFLLHSYIKNFNKNSKLNEYFRIDNGIMIYDYAKKINNTINTNLLNNKPWFIMPHLYHHGHITIPSFVFKNIKYREGEYYKRGQDAVFIRDILATYGRNKNTGFFIDLPLTNYIPSIKQ